MMRQKMLHDGRRFIQQAPETYLQLLRILRDFVGQFAGFHHHLRNHAGQGPGHNEKSRRKHEQNGLRPRYTVSLQPSHHRRENTGDHPRNGQRPDDRAQQIQYLGQPPYGRRNQRHHGCQR